ncbi:MAG: DUF177 domain-containing protein [Gammaproteobacteria bacterium]|nr:DUF177 domain-containing protein [Gammaproteobacteria bacterium]
MSVYQILPRSLPVRKLGVQYIHVIGHISLADLARFNELAVSSVDKLPIELEFKSIGKNKILVDGLIKQEITVSCQRCMEEMQYLINTKISVVLIDILSRIDKNLADYEPIEISPDDMLDLYQLIEDELILSLPCSIKHSQAQLDNCKIDKLYNY